MPDVSPDIATALRSRGEDVVSASDGKSHRLSDEQHLIRATADGRALMSFNYHDFLPIAAIWFKSNRSHAGIIVGNRQYRRRDFTALTRVIIALMDRVDAASARDSVLVLDDFR